MSDKFKSARVARRKMIRVGYQCIKTARRLNARHNNGHTNKAVVGVLHRLRGYKIVRFAGLVA